MMAKITLYSYDLTNDTLTIYGFKNNTFTTYGFRTDNMNLSPNHASFFNSGVNKILLNDVDLTFETPSSL